MTKSMLQAGKTIHTMYCFVCMAIFTKLLTSVTSQPWIFPADITAINLNSSLTMTCNYTGLPQSRVDFRITWFKNKAPQGQTPYNCSNTNGQLNPTEYNFTCPDLNLQSITIKRADLTLHNTTWKCEFGIPFGGGSIPSKNQLTIVVNVPLTMAIVTNPSSNEISVMEGVRSKFVCETSPCRPEATVIWYKQGVTAVEQVVTQTATAIYSATRDNLIITTSTMYYNVSQKDMNYTIYCKGRNNDQDTVTSEHQPKINVLYAPVDGPVIQKVGGTNYSLMENAKLTLTCIITGGNPRPMLTWTCNGGITMDTNFGSNTSVILTWKAERGKDGPCTCTSYHPAASTNRSDFVNVVILYPPSTPVILLNGTPTNGPVTIVNNTDVPLNCSSSSNPLSTYVWQYSESQLNRGSVSLKVQESGVATCTASNTITLSAGETQTYSSNKTLMLHSLYGPSQTNVFCLSENKQQLIDDGSVHVINGDELTLTCLSNGDPHPDYTWNGQHGQNVTISILQDNLIYNCTASNVLKPDYGSEMHMRDSKRVRIIRQYAPTKPTSTYTLSDDQFPGKLISSLSVVENSSFVLTCGNSSSVPKPNYQWTGEMNSTTGHLNVKTIKRSPLVDSIGTSYYKYTCIVRNKMTNTCGDKRTQIGKFDNEKRVNVLFATVLDTVPGQSILEGEHFSLTATVIAPGSPRGTYKWLYHKTETSKTTEIADSLSKTLHNISRSQAGLYTIVATNHISPTGQTSYTESVNRTFYLDVFYPSNVSLFTINEQGDTCTVNENTTVTFVCGVDSHPLSVVYIDATTYNGESRLTTLLTAKQVEHTLQKATCYDSGLYRCIGQNNYTSKSVSLDNQLLVRCTPRPRYDVEQNITFHKALDSSVTLNLTLIAFPEPPAERLKWEKVDGENTTDIINSMHIQITTTGLATNLTINRLKQTDFGQYRLIVNYTYIHYFYISPQGVPQVPTDVTHVQDKLTETSAVLKWMPGFDGGLSQTFNILYRRKSDSTWSSTIVAGSNVTLINLVPATLYYVKMFASNSIGNSSETDELNITTKERTEDESSLPIAEIAGVSGCAVALVVIVIVIVFVVLRRNRRKGQTTDQGRKSLCNDGPIYDSDGMERNMAYESAEALGFQKPSTSIDVYAQVDKARNNAGENTYAVVEKSRKTGITPTGDSDVYAMPIKKKADKKAKKSKKTKGGNKKGQNVYENAQELINYKTAVQTNESTEENIYEKGEGNEISKRNVNQDGLLYADLAFDNNNKGQKKLVIRGLENATDYVEVDFSKKAEPLPESDGEGDIA